ncbi:hypothetical protein [Roseibium sp.]
MMMLKTIFARRYPTDDAHGGRCTDPMDHPAIQRMSARELADLPINRG